jgi:hypothetical protein
MADGHGMIYGMEPALMADGLLFRATRASLSALTRTVFLLRLISTVPYYHCFYNPFVRYTSKVHNHLQPDPDEQKKPGHYV